MFLNQGPPGPNRKTILLEFCLDAMGKASEFFIWQIKSELDLTSTLNKEAIIKLEETTKELK